MYRYATIRTIFGHLYMHTIYIETIYTYTYTQLMRFFFFSFYDSFSCYGTCMSVYYKLLMHSVCFLYVHNTCHESKIRYMIIFFHLEMRIHLPDASASAATAIEYSYTMSTQQLYSIHIYKYCSYRIERFIGFVSSVYSH